MLVAKRLLAFLCVVAFAFACLTLIPPTDHVHARDETGCSVSVRCSTCPSADPVSCSGKVCEASVGLEGVLCDNVLKLCPLVCE